MAVIVKRTVVQPGELRDDRAKTLAKLDLAAGHLLAAERLLGEAEERGTIDEGDASAVSQARAEATSAALLLRRRPRVSSLRGLE
jgi:hypothetical protein